MMRHTGLVTKHILQAVAVMVLGCGVAAGQAAALPSGGQASQAAAEPDPTKPLTVVVFTDFACPFSAQTYLTLEQLTQHNPGQLHVVYKQSPLSIHPGAELAHRAALAAAAQGRYEQMATLLYANQQRQDLPSLLAYASQLHLDVARFRRDMDSAGVAAALAADEAEAQAFGIDQTPTLFVAGRKVMGSQTEASLAQLIKTANARQLQTGAETPASRAQLSPAVAAAVLEHPAASRGPVAAPLTIVEFTDFQCPFCRQAVEPMERFAAAHPNDVRWVVHSFPLDFHPDSELANEAALAAGEQGRYWDMHDAIFAHQAAIKAADLRDYAQGLHLDMARYDAALASHRFAGSIAADRALGQRANIDGTPTFIVDGQELTGALSEPELEQMLAQHKAGTTTRATTLASSSPAETLILGNAKAAVTLTWYTDVRSTQAAAQADRVRALAGRYPGDLRVIYRPFPLTTHADGRLAAAALLAAAAEGRFWPLYDALASMAQPLTRDDLLALAARLSLANNFATVMDAQMGVVESTLDDAARRGILGAPVIYLNDKRVDGLQQEALYSALIDRELHGAAPAIAAGTR